MRNDLLLQWFEQNQSQAEPDYFYVQANEENCEVQFLKLGTVPVPYDLEYSFDRETWTSFTENGSVTIPTIGAKLFIRGDNPNAKMGSNTSNRNCITSNKHHKIGGNIMSLVDKSCQATAVGERMFYAFFANAASDDRSTLDDISDLRFNFTTVGAYGCARMFYARGTFNYIPQLPATKVGTYGYYQMFSSNLASRVDAFEAFPKNMTLGSHAFEQMFQYTNIITAPALPNTMKVSCFQGMFQNCAKLTTAPELPATALLDSCYQSMFNGCASLTTAPTLPARNLASNCYRSMFQGCTKLTTAPDLPATTLRDNCYNSMFNGCTSLTGSITLPATTLVTGCYDYLLYNCDGIGSIIVGFTDWEPGGAACTSYWVYGLDRHTGGTFTCPSGLSEEHGNDRIPTGWTVVRQ